MDQNFFVCGAPKSGTTWLQTILDLHPDVSCGGEGHFIELLAFPLGGLINAYNAKLKLVTDRVYQGQEHYPQIQQAEFDAMARALMITLMSRNKGASSAAWLGDKTPRYTEHLERLIRIFPLSRMFHIVRDPRDVIVSRFHHARRAGIIASVADATPAQRVQTIDNAVAAWLSSVDGVARFRGSHSKALLEVRYEDLLTDPAAEIVRVFAHLNINLEGAALDKIILDSAFSAMSGGIAQGENHPKSFFRSGISGEYREVMTPAEQASVVQRLGPQMERYGYL
jgi:hypothetical protein